MASSSSSSAAAPPPPLPPPPSAAKKGFLRRVLPVLLVTNLAVGVYVFIRTSQKQSAEKSEKKEGANVDAYTVSKESAVPEKTYPTQAVPERVERPPIPEAEQRELLKWILEEKRKVKPKNKEEKKKIDDEKALLKQIIRAESIPKL